VDLETGTECIALVEPPTTDMTQRKGGVSGTSTPPAPYYEDSPLLLESDSAPSMNCLGRFMEVLYAPPRVLFRWTVPEASKETRCGGCWPITVAVCITYTLGLSYSMVTIASRSICLLGIRKNALGSTVLCLAAGFPDLITALVLCNRPGMQQMAASNAFGAYAFNAFVALGLPWVVLGFTGDVFPPARGTMFTGMVGFLCTILAVLAILLSGLRLTRTLGVLLLLMYAFYLTTVIHDGLTRLARLPE